LINNNNENNSALTEDMPIEKFLELISKAKNIIIDNIGAVYYKLFFDSAIVIDCHKENPEMCQEGSYRIEFHINNNPSIFLFSEIESIKSSSFIKENGKIEYMMEVFLKKGTKLFIEFDIESEVKQGAANPYLIEKSGVAHGWVKASRLNAYANNCGKSNENQELFKNIISGNTNAGVCIPNPQMPEIEHITPKTITNNFNFIVTNKK